MQSIINPMLNFIKLPPADSESAYVQKRRKYIFFSYPIVLLAYCYFFYLFNFNYQSQSVNFVFVPTFFIILFSPLIYAITKSYYSFAYIFFVVTIFFVYYLIFSVGGIRAPGLFWIVATPVFAATILGKRGAILSIGLVIGAVALFYMLDQNQIYFPVKIQLQDVIVEKMRNILLFSFFFIGIFIYYLTNEEKAEAQLSAEKDKVDNLLRLIIHDFATPLSIIDLYSKKISSIQDLSTLEAQKRHSLYMQKIQKNGTQLQEIITQMRSLKALKDGKYNIELERVSVCDTIKTAIEQVHEKLKSKNITIKYTPTGTYYINGHQLILKGQVIVNLLTNAIKFTAPGDEIKITCEQISNNAVIRVIDHGIGMPEVIKDQIFNTNAQTSRKGTEGESGTGYGMPIVYEFVKTMGGEVSINSIEKTDSTTNHGTTITLTFPILA